jgi:hypothetical protein
MAGSDVRNLDKATHSKEFTTVGAEFGEIDLGSGERLQLVGSPGQDRLISCAAGALCIGGRAADGGRQRCGRGGLRLRDADEDRSWTGHL